MTDEQKKYLTEFLGECPCEYKDNIERCTYICPDTLRSFTTEPDMMALYRRMVEMGEWRDFNDQSSSLFLKKENADNLCDYCEDYTAWLFCLSGEGYEDRCRMVADWLRREK